MNKQLLMLGLSGALVLTTACTKKLDTDDKKASYAIGQQIGQNLKNQGIEINADILAMSIKDVVGGKEAKLKPEEQQAALMKLQENLMKKQTEEAEKNKGSGTAWLKKNKSAAGIQTTASGLQYIVVQQGTGKTPGPNDIVKAHYTGTLIDGSKFDSSVDRGQPAEFPVNGVIKGWTEALQLMKVGSKYKLFIPADLAYGDRAAGPKIGANSTLIFEVELLNIKGK